VSRYVKMLRAPRLGYSTKGTFGWFLHHRWCYALGISLCAQRSFAQCSASAAPPHIQNRRQKVVNRGALRLCRGAWNTNLKKIPLIYSVSYFNLEGLELCLGGIRALFGGGAKPTKAPRGDGAAHITVSCLLRRSRLAGSSRKEHRLPQQGTMKISLKISVSSVGWNGDLDFALRII